MGNVTKPLNEYARLRVTEAIDSFDEIGKMITGMYQEICTFLMLVWLFSLVGVFTGYEIQFMSHPVSIAALTFLSVFIYLGYLGMFDSINSQLEFLKALRENEAVITSEDVSFVDFHLFMFITMFMFYLVMVFFIYLITSIFGDGNNHILALVLAVKLALLYRSFIARKPALVEHANVYLSVIKDMYSVQCANKGNV